MLEPLSAVDIIYSLAKAIYTQVKMVNANQTQFHRLAERIKSIENSIKGLHKVPDSEQYKLALNAFKDCLNDCLTFVQQFTGEHWFKQVLMAGTYRDKFDKLNNRLKQSMIDLNLGLSVQQIMNRAEDKKDQEQDYQEICKKQDEIIRLNQEELQQIQKLTMQQEEQNKILFQQMESMRLQIQHLNIANPAIKLPLDRRFMIPYFDILFDKKLGKSSFGTVYLARWCEQPMAIKTLEGEFTEETQQQLIREIKIMSRLRSPSVTQLYGACLESGRTCLAMEYMERGCLYDILGQITLSSEQQQNIALDIARGLHYLHLQGMLHRNLNSAKALINKAWQAKLSGFSIAKVHSASITTIKDPSYTLQWMAPEIFYVHSTYTEQSDIYSYGVVLWEIFTGMRPYAGLSESEVVQRITQGKTEKIPANIPSIYAEIIRLCWSPNPKERPALSQIIRKIESSQIRPASPNAEMLYDQGSVCEKKEEHQEAFRLYQQSAIKGNSKALLHLGFFHLKGFGTEQNKSQAYQCFFKAATKGNVLAQYNLATMLKHGDGIKKDIEQARLWYQKAADQGDTKAQEKLMKLTSV